MIRLFIELYLDEDVDVLVADLLRARGFDVLKTRDAGNLHAYDDEQLRFAVSKQRTFLTHSRADFESLHQTYLNTGQQHEGIIIATRHPPYDTVLQRSIGGWRAASPCADTGAESHLQRYDATAYDKPSRYNVGA